MSGPPVNTHRHPSPRVRRTRLAGRLRTTPTAHDPKRGRAGRCLQITGLARSAWIAARQRASQAGRAARRPESSATGPTRSRAAWSKAVPTWSGRSSPTCTTRSSPSSSTACRRACTATDSGCSSATASGTPPSRTRRSRRSWNCGSTASSCSASRPPAGRSSRPPATRRRSWWASATSASAAWTSSWTTTSSAHAWPSTTSWSSATAGSPTSRAPAPPPDGSGARATWSRCGRHSLAPYIMVEQGDCTEEGGALAARSLLTRDPRPTAIFAANDLVAMGVLSAAAELGLRVPEDLSVIGYDNIHLRRDPADLADHRRPAPPRHGPLGRGAAARPDRRPRQGLAPAPGRPTTGRTAQHGSHRRVKSLPGALQPRPGRLQALVKVGSSTESGDEALVLTLGCDEGGNNA